MREAFDASSSDWSVVPKPITIEIARGDGSFAVPGEIVLDADLRPRPTAAGLAMWA